MQIYKISTEEYLHFLLKRIEYGRITENILLCDEFFGISLGTLQRGGQFNRVYSPLKEAEFKNRFALFEILPSCKGFYVRVRKDKMVDGADIKKEDLNFFLNSHKAFYTTFSVEESLIDYPFERAIDSGFSLIHFFHQAPYGVYPLENMAIVADPANNLNGAYEEGKELFRWISSLKLKLKLSFFSGPLSSDCFDQILSNFSLVHFCGHVNEDGLNLGKETYHPSFSQKKLPELLFLNGCKLFNHNLLAWIKRKAKNLVYFQDTLEDEIMNIALLKKFYAGIFCGYRISDIAIKTLDFKKSRIYGWASNRFVL